MPTLTWTYVDLIAAVGDPIDYEAFDEIQANVNAINAAVGPACGVDTFNGTAGRDITFATAQPDTDYIPFAVATEDTLGNLGDVYYTNIATTGFTVHCTGTFTGDMKWKILR